MKTLSQIRIKSCIVILCLFFAFLSKNAFSQTDTLLLQKQTDRIKVTRHGKGNNTFSLTVSKLESVINNHITLKTLESQLGVWSSDGYENSISFEYSEKTKDMTTPLFEISYNIPVKNKYATIKAEVSNNLNNHIRLLEITVAFTGMQLAEFKEALKMHGYLLNENLTGLYNESDISSTGYLSYEKRNRKMIISIKYLSSGSYTIVIS